MMIEKKVTDRHSPLTLGIKVPGVIRDGEFTFPDVKTISILRSPKFHHKFLLSPQEGCLGLPARRAEMQTADNVNRNQATGCDQRFRFVAREGRIAL